MPVVAVFQVDIVVVGVVKVGEDEMVILLGLGSGYLVSKRSYQMRVQFWAVVCGFSQSQRQEEEVFRPFENRFLCFESLCAH
jgi:hypothetical protein